MKVGDLVKMKRGYSESGLILEVVFNVGIEGRRIIGEEPKWVRIHWPDYGPGIEKIRDLEVVR